MSDHGRPPMNERLAGDFSGALDLWSAMRHAEEAGDHTAAAALKQDVKGLIDQSNAGTMFDMIASEFGLTPEHPEYDLVRGIAERVGVACMEMARTERVPDDALTRVANESRDRLTEQLGKAPAFLLINPEPK